MYAGSRGRIEETVDGFVIDVATDNELIEIQTRGFTKLRRKIELLRDHHRLRIVYPIAQRTLLLKMDTAGSLLSRRRSPKRGRLESVFRELTSIADLLPHPAVAIEIVMVHAVERRVADGKGSWRRRGVSIVSRAVEEVVSTRTLVDGCDYLELLPPSLADTFTNSDVGRAGSLPYAEAQSMTSSLRKMGLIEIAGKDGRRLLYRRGAG